MVYVTFVVAFRLARSLLLLLPLLFRYLVLHLSVGMSQFPKILVLPRASFRPSARFAVVTGLVLPFAFDGLGDVGLQVLYTHFFGDFRFLPCIVWVGIGMAHF